MLRWRWRRGEGVGYRVRGFVCSQSVHEGLDIVRRSCRSACRVARNRGEERRAHRLDRAVRRQTRPVDARGRIHQDRPILRSASIAAIAIAAIAIAIAALLLLAACAISTGELSISFAEIMPRRQPKVDQVHLAILSALRLSPLVPCPEQYVVWLEVIVHNPVAVEGAEAAEDRTADAHHRRCCNREQQAPCK